MDIQTIKHMLAEIGVRYRENVQLKTLTTFRIGGPCPLVVFCSMGSQLEEVMALFREHDLHLCVIGEGSNLLVSDDGVPYPIVQFLADDAPIECLQNQIATSAAARLDDIARIAAEKGLKGINFVSGIPGTVGGAVIGNAGAFGFQIGDCVEEVEILRPDGEVRVLKHTGLKFAYRHSILKDTRNILLSVVFQLEKADAEDLLEEREHFLSVRRDRHPDYHVVPCAGSFFKNIVQPDGTRQAAGWFLDRCGCKDLAVGDAAVFEKHANIIINRNQATAKDVMSLAVQMKARVYDKFGIELQPEVHLIELSD